MLSGMRFRPKGTGSDSKGSLPVPASFPRIKSVRDNRILAVVVVVIILWMFRPLLWASPFSSLHSRYPQGLPPGVRHNVPLVSPYIYPPIEDADILRKMDPLDFVTKVPSANGEGELIKSLNYLDDEDPVKQKIKEDNENAASDVLRAKNHFKNQAKIVFQPKLSKNYPKVVVVTAVDFTKYLTKSLAKIIQNRVNYAHEHGYGIYVRWYQEFFHEVESMDYLKDEERAKWMRLFCLRAAMHAFPEAEWLWYLDQDGVITNMKVDLEAYLLTANALKGASLRDHPIIPPNGLIRTYKNVNPDNVHFVFTQGDHKVESNSFIVRNDAVGRGMVDHWRGKLYLDYSNFPFGPDSALTHILQWHPFILSKTVLVSARTINSLYDEKVGADKKTSDHTHYFPGDFVALWPLCKSSTDCELVLNKFLPDK